MFRYLLAATLLMPAGLSAQSAGKPLTRDDLETFLDALIPNELQHGDIAGAVVTVVKDGQLLLSKGYGWSDIARRVPVFPDSTVFRIASISKTFNATAVMQLVEQGKLNLDADIQQYLDFPLPKKFPEPITLRHLLTHTAGFEESAKELTPAPGETSVELGLLMKEATPHQIYHPGTVTAYSNYGADLAGYIVERVSGMPFEEYIRQHITAPLGMNHSSFAEPLPPEIMRLVSNEYTLASDDSARKFEVIQGEPSGNMSSTGMDMARYMIMHLQLGRFDSVRILAESTSRYMSTTQFRTHPAVPGMAVGFFEESRDGYRMIGHGGDLSNFHSHMTMLLDEGVGFFISVNSAGKGGGLFGIRETVIDAFMHRYFPRKTPLEPALANAAEQSKKVVGPYQLSRRGETTLFKVAGLTLPIEVVANKDGTIQVPLLTGENGQPMRWYLIEPMVYRNEGGNMRLGFLTDSTTGEVTRAGFLGGHELHKVGRLDSVKFNYWFIGTCFTIMAATLLLWPVAAIVRRRYNKPLPDDGLSPRFRGLTRIAVLVAFALVIGFAYFFGATLGKGGRNSSIDIYLRGFQLLGVLSVLGGAACVLAFFVSLFRGSNGYSKLKYAGLAFAMVGFSWFILHWNILTRNLDF
ncbi:MAG TPA: serine hydrolase domain-containing protein [Gemmatimonadales bacterium]|nr:serine hydrolase domain-containing protein [Gemmatimonadales bacterium]